MIELTNLQKKILKIINSGEDINCETLYKKLNIDWYDCISNVQILQKNNLIRIDREQFLHPLPFGKAYFELETKHTLEDFIKSFVLPFFISLITTLVTLWLKGL